MRVKSAKKHEPCPIEWMYEKSSQETICEVLRQTFRLTENDMIRNNLRVAMTMAKRMELKLREYSRWDKNFWDKKDKNEPLNSTPDTK